MATPTPVEALGPGDHACLTFSDPEERLDIVAAFVRDGLDHGQKVICYTESVAADQLVGEFAGRRVATAEPSRRGQFAVRDSDDTWLAGGTVTATGMIDLLSAELDLARDQGYPGLRITADMCWATRPLSTVDQLLVFESRASKLFADGRLTAICEYDRTSFDPVTLAFAARTHPRAVAATVYHEDPVLRVCRQHSPPGIRAAGELDYTRLEAIHQALGEALRIDQHVHVNLAELRFIDAAAAAAIVRAAHRMPEGRVMTVVCGELVGRMLDMVGGVDVRQLRVLVAHDKP